jgi:hypothetical protein
MRIYNNEGTKNETLDCITAIFTKKRVDKQFMHIGASINGYGFYQHGASENMIDRPSYGHLGKKIGFNDLSPELQKRFMQEYCELWDITEN